MNVLNFHALLILLFSTSSSLAVSPRQALSLYSSCVSALGVSNATDGFKQTLAWETTPSVRIVRQHQTQSKIQIASVPSKKVQTWHASDLPKELLPILDTNQPQFAWLQHPYNTDYDVPFYHETPVASFIADHTASRTMNVEIAGRQVGIKLPTTHPFGPQGDIQPEKVKLGSNIKYAKDRTQVVTDVDKAIGKDPNLIMIRDFATFADTETGNGGIFRDHEPLNDGHYYLGAHLIPYVGKTIAESHGRDVYEYWGEHWAKALGVIYSKLLLRYGIEFLYIQPQNFKIQMQKRGGLYYPTGAMAVIDMSDSNLISWILDSIFTPGHPAYGMPSLGLLDADVNGYLAFFFDSEDAIQPITDEELKQWQALFRASVAEYLSQEINFSMDGPREHERDVFDFAYKLTNFFRSAYGQSQVEAWHRRQRLNFQ